MSQSTATAMSRQLVHTYFLGKLDLVQRKEENDRRNYFLISTKVWAGAWIDFATPGSAVGLCILTALPKTYVVGTQRRPSLFF